MSVKGMKKDRRRVLEQKQDDYHYRVILFWAFLISVDALIAGVGCGFMGMELLLTAVVVALITAAAATVGLICGYWLGCAPMNKMVAVGGGLIIVGGADLLFRYLVTVL